MPRRRPLVAGDFYTREDLVIEYGGAVSSGGIVPSNASETVFVFTDPGKSSQFGYVYDGFSEDGDIFYYTGAGQVGDQTPTKANSAIMTAAERGRSIHAFAGAGRVPGKQTIRQRYVGEFILDPAIPYERMPALDRDGALRTVLVFRLLPVREVTDVLRDHVGRSEITNEPRTLRVPLELNSTEFFETTEHAGHTSVRKESRLVDDFVASQRDHDFSRWAITIPHERIRLLTDVYDATDRVLYEAKSIANRTDLRMAVGQLYDYRRHVDVDSLRCSVLLPERPSADLRDYLARAGLGLAFKSGDRFEFELDGFSERTAVTQRAGL